MRPGNLLALLLFFGILATTFGCGPAKPTTVTPAANGGATPAASAASDSAKVD